MSEDNYEQDSDWDMEYLEDLAYLQDLANLATNAVREVEAFEEATSRRWWVRPINTQRPQQGAAQNLVREMRYQDDEEFFNFTRMNFEQFDNLLQLIAPSLTKTSIRTPISPETRLLLTLRYLATGDSFRSLHFHFRIGYSTVPKIVYETCSAIYNSLRTTQMPELNRSSLEAIATGFEERTSYPHIIGAIDGKHVMIKAPPSSGSQYYNYKKQYSIVLLGVCDSNYKFIYFNVGSHGSQSDGGIFRSCALGRALENGELDLPPPRPVNGSTTDVPYFLVGDAAFPLRPYLMTPYCGRHLTNEELNYNKELSRGRCTIENSFGILAARWRVFSTTISISPSNADKIVLAAVMLHNYIISSDRSRYANNSYVDQFTESGERTEGQWRAEAASSIMFSIPHSIRIGSRNATSEARAIRDNIKSIINIR